MSTYGEKVLIEYEAWGDKKKKGIKTTLDREKEDLGKENEKVVESLREAYEAGAIKGKLIHGSQSNMVELSFPGKRQRIILQHIKDNIYVILSIYVINAQRTNDEKRNAINERANIVASKKDLIYAYATKEDFENQKMDGTYGNGKSQSRK